MVKLGTDRYKKLLDVIAAGNQLRSRATVSLFHKSDITDSRR